MRDYFELGPTPADEQCEQVGPNFNAQKARKESLCYIKQLRREFGEEPEGARLTIKSFPHDFGSYSEVVCYFEDQIKESVEYAFKCENGMTEWDEISRKELFGPNENTDDSGSCGNSGGVDVSNYNGGTVFSSFT